MKGGLLWKVLLIAGLIPFVAPFVIFCILSTRNPGLSGEFMIYSIFYWPTYAVGIALIVLSMIIKLRHDS